MPSKRDILAKLTVVELRSLINLYHLTVSGRPRKDHLVKMLASSRNYRFAKALQILPRDRLKGLCRFFGLDDGGVRKADLAARLTNSRRKKLPHPRQGRPLISQSSRPSILGQSKFRSMDEKPPCVGLDFGTSNCAMGVWWNHEPVVLPLQDGAKRMPSVLFLARKQTDAPVAEVELGRRVQSAMTQQTIARNAAQSSLTAAEQSLARTKSSLRSYEQQLSNAKGGRTATDWHHFKPLVDGQAREVETRQTNRDILARQVESLSKSEEELVAEQTRVLRREAFQRDVEAAARQHLGERLAQATGTYFGNDAIRQHLEGDQGSFMASPKSFIGADVPRRQLTVFVDVIARMMTYMRAVALRRFSDTGLTVIGRPVHFRGTAGTPGDAQAEQVLREAATGAGFEAVEFLFEPIAAALDYERTLDRDKILLVVDVGGGTTDCSMIRVGPSRRDRIDRKPDVLGSDGVRLGGRDLDVALSHGTIAPLLGKDTYLSDGLPFPSYYVDSALSMDIPTREVFHSSTTEANLRALANRSLSPEYIERLLAVQQSRLGQYVLWQAEAAKIKLSRFKSTSVTVDRIESGLRAPVNRRDYEKFAADTHRRLISVVDDVVSQAGTRPDEVYVTGGMAQSPSLRAELQTRFGDRELVDGDYFGSVVSGLTTWAHRRSHGAEE